MSKPIVTTLLLTMLAGTIMTACTQLSKEDRALLTSTQATARQASDEAIRANATAEQARSDAQAAKQSASKAAEDAKVAQDKANRIFRQSQSK